MPIGKTALYSFCWTPKTIKEDENGFNVPSGQAANLCLGLENYFKTKLVVGALGGKGGHENADLSESAENNERWEKEI